jgi:2'-5' RNA ligase
LRTFIAIELSDDLRSQLRDQMDRIQADLGLETIRWVRPTSIHLTLKFLGEVSPEKIDSITNQMEQVAAEHDPFIFRAESFGCFPSIRKPRVLWVGVAESSGMLSSIQRDLERRLAQLGFKRERRPFHPHLTLGRLHRRIKQSEVQSTGSALEDFQVGVLGDYEVKDLCLFKSDLRPTGAVYTCLKRISLSP